MRIKAGLSVILVLVLFVSIAAAESLLPKADTLFGVTMPDVRFALEREADTDEQNDEDRTFTYGSEGQSGSYRV